MNFYPLIIFTAVVISHDRNAFECEENFQLALLRIFFADLTALGCATLSANSPLEPDNCLEWEGVSCKNGFVQKVEYFDREIGNFNIHALPPSTTAIRISKCRQSYPVKTRMLPKGLTQILIDNNEIYGTIDLMNLPSLLEILDAAYNRICGPVDFTGLPAFLKELDLKCNKIDQEVILYGNFPANINNIHLWHQIDVQKEPGVRAMSCYDELSQEKAKEIFGMKLQHEPYRRSGKKRSNQKS